MSSSRLTLDATLESALMTFEADTVVLPSRLDEMPVSSDELGVTGIEMDNQIIISVYSIENYCGTYDFLHWDYYLWRWACCCCVRGNWTSSRVYRRRAARNLDTISSNWSLRFAGTKVNQSMRVRKLMICFYKETTNRRTKAEDSITKGVRSWPRSREEQNAKVEPSFF